MSHPSWSTDLKCKAGPVSLWSKTTNISYMNVFKQSCPVSPQTCISFCKNIKNNTFSAITCFGQCMASGKKIWRFLATNIMVKGWSYKSFRFDDWIGCSDDLHDSLQLNGNVNDNNYNPLIIKLVWGVISFSKLSKIWFAKKNLLIFSNRVWFSRRQCRATPLSWN